MQPQYAAPPRHVAYPAPEGPRPAEAWRMLRDAIEHGSENELGRLVDRALQAGAQFNQAQGYDEHVLVMATRANRPWAIAVLMARGAELPAVPENGIDLLMEACTEGHAAMAEALIVDAGYGIREGDHSGKTALHCATISGSVAIVHLLLKSGAKVDKSTTDMTLAELESLFGREHELEGCKVTPLMIAAARGDDEIVKALADAGAHLDEGGCGPVILAARRGHTSTIALLLREGAEVPVNVDETGRPALSSVLHFHGMIECLRLLAPLHDYSEDDGSAESPIGIAIDCGDATDVALLLGCGARIDPNNADSETLWDIAVQMDHDEDKDEKIDLMAASVCEPIPAGDHVKFGTLLEQIIQCSSDPAQMASAGLFPSLLRDALPSLLPLRIDRSTSPNLQSCLQAAWELTQCLPALHAPDTQLANDAPPDQRWKQQTAQSRHAQRQALHAGSAAFVAQAMDKLPHVLTFDFFLECDASCPPDEDLYKFMKKRLAEDYGMPDELNRLVSKSWIGSARRAQEWHVAPDSLPDTNQFVATLATSLMRKALQNLDTDDQTLPDQCATILGSAIALQPAPLTQFCADPVRWLRRFENRNHLQPIDAGAFARSLQIALGLPQLACNALADAWQHALRTARNSRQWRTPAELQALLTRAMATQAGTALDDEDSVTVMLPQDRQAFVQWAANMAGAAPVAAPAPAPAPVAAAAPAARATDARPGKRPASGEPDGAPPNKEARI